MLHGWLNMMREVFTLPASIFCSAEHRHLGLEILEDTAIVNVMGGFYRLQKNCFPPIQLMADDSVGHFISDYSAIGTQIITRECGRRGGATWIY